MKDKFIVMNVALVVLGIVGIACALIFGFAPSRAADAQFKQGAIGFFRAMGADSAIEIIQNCTYKDYTEIGNSLDATGLENMLSSITVMKNVNAYRKSVGLSELEVSYKLIAAAIADANYSTKNVEHAQQFETVLDE